MSRSNLTEQDQYTAENAIQNEDPLEDIKHLSWVFIEFQILTFIFLFFFY